MVKQKIYPNYTDNYYYNLGDDYIELKRTESVYGGILIYKRIIQFNKPEEAKDCFEDM